MSRQNLLHQIALVTALVAAGTLLFGCSEQSNTEQANAAESTKRVIPVAVARVTSGEFIRTVAATGTIVPRRQAEIRAGVSGRVEKLHVDIGDAVRAGQLLVEIDPDFYQAQYEQAKVAAEKAEADLQRNEQLFTTGDISATLIEGARVQAKTAVVNFKNAERQLRDARIRSPFDGWIATLPIETGSSISPGAEIVAIVDINTVILEMGVSAEDVAHLKNGQAANLTLDALPGKSFTGKVTAVGPMASPNTRLFPIEITVKNTQELLLRGGMVARAEIEYQRLAEAVLVPRDAVTDKYGERVVFVISEQTARRRVPQIGAMQGEYYLIESGLQPGETVVVAGQEALADGKKVATQEQQPGKQSASE